MQHQSRSASAVRPTPGQAIFVIAVLIPIVAGYIGLGSAIGIQALFMGFLFATYWGTIRMLALPDYLPTVLGSLTGILIAYLLHALPIALGTPGVILALVATVAPLYCLIRQQAQLFLNPAFIVFLTVATIPALGKQDQDFLAMAIGTVFGAVYMRAIVFALAKISAMRKPKPAPAVPAAGPA